MRNQLNVLDSLYGAHRPCKSWLKQSGICYVHTQHRAPSAESTLHTYLFTRMPLEWCISLNISCINFAASFSASILIQNMDTSAHTHSLCVQCASTSWIGCESCIYHCHIPSFRAAFYTCIHTYMVYKYNHTSHYKSSEYKIVKMQWHRETIDTDDSDTNSFLHTFTQSTKHHAHCTPLESALDVDSTTARVGLLVRTAATAMAISEEAAKRVRVLGSPSQAIVWKQALTYCYCIFN